MATSKKKKQVPITVKADEKLSDLQQAALDIRAELLKLNEQQDEKIGLIVGCIEDALDIMLDEYGELKDELEELKTTHEALEKDYQNLTVADIAEYKLEACGTIAYQADNVVDDWIMEALSKLLTRPHETLAVLEALSNPRIAAEVQNVIELDAMLY